MPRPEIDSIHFDMYGVIVDSERLHVAAEQQTCRDHGFAIDPTTWGGFKGQTAPDIFRHLIQTYGDPDVHDVASLIEYKTERFLQLAEAELQPIESATDFLKWSRENYKVMNLVTSSNRRVQEFVIGRLGIAHLFDHIVNGDDVARGKPHPEPYLRSMELAGARPETALVVEDSKSGIQSALAANCMVLAIATSHSADELKAASPTFIAEDYDDARRHLDPHAA